MKGLTLTQPYATEMTLQAEQAAPNKTIETRGFRTKYRGLLAIHAAIGFDNEHRRLAETERALGRIPARLPRGAIVCVVDLKNIVETREAVLHISALEKYLGNYAPGRWAWMTKHVYTFKEPIWCPGWQGLRDLPDAVEEQVVAAMELGL